MAKQRVIRIHYLIPAEAAPAPHMTGGVIETGEPRLGALGTGKPHVCACDPKVVLDEMNMGTGEWFAVACRACGATEAYKVAKETIPDPRAARGAGEVESMEGCC